MDMATGAVVRKLHNTSSGDVEAPEGSRSQIVAKAMVDQE
jgi:hypothetical protein